MKPVVEIEEEPAVKPGLTSGWSKQDESTVLEAVQIRYFGVSRGWGRDVDERWRLYISDLMLVARYEEWPSTVSRVCRLEYTSF